MTDALTFLAWLVGAWVALALATGLYALYVAWRDRR